MVENKTQLIGVSGFAGSGKDTFCNILIEELAKLEIVGERYAFADPIKTTINHLFGWDERHSFGILKEVDDPFWGFSPRKAYQTFGTEWGREQMDQQLWLKCAEKNMMDSIGVHYIIIPDLRFLNEEEWIKQQGGIVVGIRTPTKPGEVGISGHESEKHIPNIISNSNWIMNNDRDLGLDFLRAQVKLFIHAYIQKYPDQCFILSKDQLS